MHENKAVILGLFFSCLLTDINTTPFQIITTQFEQFQITDRKMSGRTKRRLKEEEEDSELKPTVTASKKYKLLY